MPPGRSHSLTSCQAQGGKGPPRTQLSEVDARRWDGLVAEGKTNLLMLMGWLLWSTWTLGAFRAPESQIWRARQGEAEVVLEKGQQSPVKSVAEVGAVVQSPFCTATHRVHWPPWPRDPFGEVGWAWVLEPDSLGPLPGADCLPAGWAWWVTSA